jgi:hypothetical protein
MMPSVAPRPKSTNANSPPEGEAAAGHGREPGHPPDAEQHGDLQQHEAQGEADDEPWLLERQPQVRRHADRDEEQAEEQAFERLDVGLEFVPEFAVGEQYSGEEGPQ